MKIEHLISTMFLKDNSFFKEMNCTENILIVNQTNENSNYEKDNIRIISTKERGLSNSRNMLLKNSSGDICIIGDDDLMYLDGYANIILNAYKEHPDADIITFSFTQDLNINTRRQFKTSKLLNIFNISKIASVEITFKLKSIKNAKIQFCPLLGLGAKYGAGEENAFLADALRKGLKIWYIPKTICYLKPDPPERRKWNNGFDKEYFIKRGACFYRIYGYLFYLMSIAFLIIKKRTTFKNINIFNALFWMIEGKDDYIKESKKC